MRRLVLVAATWAIVGAGAIIARPVEHDSNASAVTGFGLGASSSGTHAPPAAYVGVLVVGQSNSTGQGESFADGTWLSTLAVDNAVQAWSTVCPSTITDGGWPPGANAQSAGQIIDAATLTQCTATMSDAGNPHWFLMPLRAPVNNFISGAVNTFPNNDWEGEQPGLSVAKQARTGALALGYSEYRWIWDGEGVSGQSIASIGIGSGAWNQMLVTETASHRLAVDAGGSHVVKLIYVDWGESDCANWGYAATLSTYLSTLVTNLKAITGQTEPIFIVQKQIQNWCSTGFAIGPTEQLVLAQQASPGGIQLGDPEYAWPQSDAHLEHLSNFGHAQSGEIAGDVFDMDLAWSLGTHEWYRPLAPAVVGAINANADGGIGTQAAPDPGTFSRSGNMLTIAMHVPAGETMTFDTSVQPQLHAFGPWAPYWSSGHGFELWTGCSFADGGGVGVPSPPGATGIVGTACTPVAISSVTIAGGTIVIVGASSFNLVAYATSPDGNLFLDGGVFDGGYPISQTVYGQGPVAVAWGPPNGRGGHLRTDYNKTGSRSGLPIQHWAAAFIQGGL